MLTVGTFEKIREKCGVNLFRVMEPHGDSATLLDAIGKDEFLQLRIMHCVYGDGDYVAWLDGVTAEMMGDMTQRFWRDLMDFFREANRTGAADLIRAKIAEIDVINRTLSEVANQVIDEMPMLIETAQADARTAISKQRSGSLPVTSG